jgi:hypothetical protein
VVPVVKLSSLKAGVTTFEGGVAGSPKPGAGLKIWLFRLTKRSPKRAPKLESKVEAPVVRGDEIGQPRVEVPAELAQARYLRGYPGDGS